MLHKQKGRDKCPCLFNAEERYGLLFALGNVQHQQQKQEQGCASLMEHFQSGNSGNPHHCSAANHVAQIHDTHEAFHRSIGPLTFCLQGEENHNCQTQHRNHNVCCHISHTQQKQQQTDNNHRNQKETILIHIIRLRNILYL